VQIYTALVYEGPSLPRRINEELLALMGRDGVKGIGEVIGAERRESVSSAG
jgi:dihydroorotate dehydrogenase